MKLFQLNHILKQRLFMKRVSWVFAIATIVVCSLTLTSSASQYQSPEVKRFYDYVSQRVGELVSVSSFPEKQEAWIEFKIDETGEIKSPTLTRSCGDSNVDFACLEAVFEASPLVHSKDGGSGTSQCIVLVLNAPKVRFREHISQIQKETGKGSYLLHLIPRKQVFKSLLGADILESADNIISLGTSKKRAFSILSKLENSWSEFLRKHPDPTEAEVLKQADWSVANFRLPRAKVLTDQRQG